MKIIDTRVPNTCHFFREISVGTVFEFENNNYSEGFFMKIDEVVDKDEDCVNAVNLYNGALETFCGSDMVIAVDAELRIAYKN